MVPIRERVPLLFILFSFFFFFFEMTLTPRPAFHWHAFSRRCCCCGGEAARVLRQNHFWTYSYCCCCCCCSKLCFVSKISSYWIVLWVGYFFVPHFRGDNYFGGAFKLYAPLYALFHYLLLSILIKASSSFLSLNYFLNQNFFLTFKIYSIVAFFNLKNQRYSSKAWK